MMQPNQRPVPAMTSLPRPLFSRHEALAPGSWTEEHTHPWCQFSYASSGVLGVRTAMGDYVAPPHFAVWIPPGVLHQVVNRGRAEMRSLYVAPEVAGALPTECCVMEMSPLAGELVQRIGELPVEYDTQGPAGRLVAVLLDELAVLRRGGFRLPLPKDRRLVAICNALQESPADPRSLNDWARHVGASERTLARLFVKETGLGFGLWRQRLRLVLSLDALQAGVGVTEVAMAHGYESPSAFIAAFRGLFGVTPGGLRGG